MDDEKRSISGADQGGETHGRLERAIRRESVVDSGYVCRGDLQGPEREKMKRGIAAACLLIVVPGLMPAQGRGGAPAGPPPTGKAMAPWDLTGHWVSEIVDEWRFRVSPIKGDILYMPLNAEARRVAGAWDPAKDEAEGNQCKAYGAIGLMQRPGRLHITWTDDNTLRLDADAGTQTRTLQFGQAPEQPGAPSLQGYSAA